MNLKGSKESKNVEDIRKQEPKDRLGWIVTDKKGQPQKPVLGKRKSQESRVKPDSTELGLEAQTSMAGKTGLHSMERALASDTSARKTFEKRFGGAATQFPAPTELKETWTPRPLKK